MGHSESYFNSLNPDAKTTLYYLLTTDQQNKKFDWESGAFFFFSFFPPKNIIMCEKEIRSWDLADGSRVYQTHQGHHAPKKTGDHISAKADNKCPINE